VKFRAATFACVIAPVPVDVNLDAPDRLMRE